MSYLICTKYIAYIQVENHVELPWKLLAIILIKTRSILPTRDMNIEKLARIFLAFGIENMQHCIDTRLR